jgi:hypothetical protein
MREAAGREDKEQKETMTLKKSASMAERFTQSQMQLKRLLFSYQSPHSYW